jgi:hypothetical protein
MPFPDKYADDFEAAAPKSEAPYLSDQARKWEVRAEKAMRPRTSTWMGAKGRGKQEVEKRGIDGVSTQMATTNKVLTSVCTEQGVVYRAFEPRLPPSPLSQLDGTLAPLLICCFN